MMVAGFLLICVIVFWPAIRSGAARTFFRIWVPSWRFFESQPDAVPGLRHRSIGMKELFLNPGGNLTHLEETLDALSEEEVSPLRDLRALPGETAHGK